MKGDTMFPVHEQPLTAPRGTWSADRSSLSQFVFTKVFHIISGCSDHVCMFCFGFLFWKFDFKLDIKGLKG